MSKCHHTGPGSGSGQRGELVAHDNAEATDPDPRPGRLSVRSSSGLVSRLTAPECHSSLGAAKLHPVRAARPSPHSAPPEVSAVRCSPNPHLCPAHPSCGRGLRCLLLGLAACLLLPALPVPMVLPAANLSKPTFPWTGPQPPSLMPARPPLRFSLTSVTSILGGGTVGEKRWRQRTGWLEQKERRPEG